MVSKTKALLSKTKSLLSTAAAQLVVDWPDLSTPLPALPPQGW